MISIAKMVQELAARDQEIKRLKALIDKLKRMRQAQTHALRSQVRATR
ncbi:MAG: hypothetical protein VB142_07710 [Burkholderia sp.]